MGRSIGSIDWLLVIIFAIITLFGVANIYSASPPNGTKQLMFAGIAAVVLITVLLSPAYIIENFAPLLYGISIVLLAGVLVLGTEVKGAKAWYNLGILSFQPAELAKISVGLMLASYCNSAHFNAKELNSLAKAIGIIIVPIFLILLQPDVGSILVFTAFFIALVREGMSSFIFSIGFYFAILFLTSINVDTNKFLLYLSVAFVVGIFIFYKFIKKRNYRTNELVNRSEIIVISIAFITSIATIVVAPYVFEKMPKHQRERIMVLFEGETKEEYRDNIGYNLLYSKSAIANGEWFGQGFNEGPVTKGKFVPEQHTDYIFCTVGEEWGFVGSVVLLLLYAIFIARIYYLAENMKSTFARVYGYSFGSILLIHYTINIGMVIGLFPTVGIPLPFFSYGGSSLVAFTTSFAIFLKLAYNDNKSLI